MTRVAVVTGAARGIGAATVRMLAGAGWAVVAVDRCSDDPRLPYALGSPDDLARVVADAGAGSARPLVRPCHVPRIGVIAHAFAPP